MLETRKEIEDWLNKYEIKNYIINDDLTVDVDGSINLSSVKFIPLKSSSGQIQKIEMIYDKRFLLDEIQVQFNICTKDFVCKTNALKSLKGCPRIVKGNFDCSKNKILISLEHLGFVGQTLICDDNLKHTNEYKAWKLLNSLRK